MTNSIAWLGPVLRDYWNYTALINRHSFTAHDYREWHARRLAVCQNLDLLHEADRVVHRLIAQRGALGCNEQVAYAGARALILGELVTNGSFHVLADENDNFDEHDEGEERLQALDEALGDASDLRWLVNVLNTDYLIGELIDQENWARYTDGDGSVRIAPRDELTECGHCHQLGVAENMDTVYVDVGEPTLWHSACAAAGHVRACALTHVMYCTDGLTEIAITDRNGLLRNVCEELCRHDDLIEYDERTDEWYEAGYVPEEDEEDESTELVDYHSAYRSWEHTPCRTNGYVGCELEVGFANGAYNQRDFLDEFTEDGRFTDGRPFIVERDGSLDGIPGGCEIISSPLPLHEGYQAANAPWRTLLRDLYQAGGQGWRHRRTAGLHVNLCVTGDTDETVLKYAMFINTARAMSCFIAGRSTLYHASYARYTPQLLSARRSITLGDVFGAGKYAAVNRRNADCLETRIFGSNIRYEGFMACVEYCCAVMAYVRLVELWQVVSPIAAAEFRGWLGTQTKRFPNLCARLGIVAHRSGTAVPSTAKLVPVLAAA